MCKLTLRLSISLATEYPSNNFLLHDVCNIYTSLRILYTKSIRRYGNSRKNNLETILVHPMINNKQVFAYLEKGRFSRWSSPDKKAIIDRSTPRIGRRNIRFRASKARDPVSLARFRPRSAISSVRATIRRWLAVDKTWGTFEAYEIGERSERSRGAMTRGTLLVNGRAHLLLLVHDEKQIVRIQGDKCITWILFSSISPKRFFFFFSLFPPLARFCN